MLIALLISMLFLGDAGQPFASRLASFDKLKERIEETIAEPQSEEQLKKYVDQVRDATKDYAEQTEKNGTRLANAIEDSKWSRVTFEDILKHHDQDRASYWNRALVARAKMRENLAREQWHKIFGIPTAPMSNSHASR